MPQGEGTYGKQKGRPPKNKKFGRNIPFGSKKSLKVEQRRAVPDIDTGKMSKTVKTGKQMSPAERRNYVSKVKSALKAKADKGKKQKVRPEHKHLGRQNVDHYKYAK